MKRLLKAFLYTLGLGVLALFLVSHFYEQPLLLTFLLVFISAGILFIRKSKEELILFISVGVSGAIAESFAIFFGAWNYTGNDWLIPLWLPLLWGIAGVYIKRASEEIRSFVKDSF